MVPRRKTSEFFADPSDGKNLHFFRGGFGGGGEGPGSVPMDRSDQDVKELD